MQTLYELIDMLPERFSPQFLPRLNQLYAFITQHEQLSAAEASELFLGEPNRVKYFNTLKNDLKKALAIYLVCYPSWSMENKNKVLYEECHKLHTSFKILILNGKRGIAMEIAKTLIPRLEKLELHTLLYSIADEMQLYYSVMTHNTKQKKKYEHIVLREFQNITDYTAVQQIYTKLFAACNHRESYSPSVIALAKVSAEQATPYLKDGRHNTNRFIYIIQLCRYVVMHEYQNVLEVCDTALSSFPAEHPNIRSLSFVFLFNKITACISLGRLVEAKRIARETIKIVPRGSFNWHLVLLRRITACLHETAYQEAYQLYKEYEKHQKSNKRHQTRKGKSAKKCSLT